MSLFTSNDLLLELLLTMDVALFTKTVEGRYSYMNQSGARMVGLRVKDIVGRTDAEIFTPRTADIIRVRDEYVRGVREPFAYDCRSTLRGETAPLAFHSIKCATRDGEGRPTGVFALSLVNRPPEGVPARVREMVRLLAESEAPTLMGICRRGSFPFAI